MKKLIALASVLTLFSPALLSQTTPTAATMSTAGPVESQLRTLEEQGVLAIQKNDPSFMQTFYADDYITIGALGQMVDKSTAIDDLKTGRTKYEKVEILDRKVTQYGPNMAITRGKAVVKAMVNGSPIEGTFAFSRTWLQRDGKWQVVAFQGSKIK